MSDRFSHFLDTLPHRRRRLKPGTLLFDRGDTVAGFYRVEQGEIHMLRRQSDGAEFILQRARAGALVAEASLFSDGYHCAAVAVGETEVTVWTCRQVQLLLEGNAEAALAYAQYMARELRRARMRSEILSLRRIADRLDAWLTWHEGRMPARGDWVHVAREIAVAPEALYRELSRRRAPTGQGRASSLQDATAPMAPSSTPRPGCRRRP